MKNQIKLTAIIFAAIFFIFSCEKESSTSNPTSNSKKQSALTDLFKNIAPPMQNFTITAGQQQVVTGEKGTKITFFSNSFKKKDGTILTSGTVKIVLQEMLTGPEMILANKTTTSDGKLLESGGQIYIKAYLGSEELRINKSEKPLVEIPTINPVSMNLFRGSIKENDSMTGDTIINWSTDTTTVTRRVDSFGSKYGFFLDSFTWTNCDRFMSNGGALTDVSITLPTNVIDTNTAVFIYATSINSVTRMYSYDKLTRKVNLGTYYRLPIGLQVKILIISKSGSQYSYEIKSVTITDNYNSTYVPAAITEAQLKSTIKSM